MSEEREVLWHYSREPFALERRTYEQDDPREYGKPHGFWISVEGNDDWPSWCEGEQFRLETLAYRSPVSFTDKANILRVTPGLMSPFDRDYSTEWMWGENGRWTARGIDWRAVAEKYDGIIIAPYSWHHRSDLAWYYPWDCASGCVWNLDAITVGESEPNRIPAAAIQRTGDAT